MNDRTARRRASCKKYEKTKKGFLMRLYRNMQSRVTGVQKRKFALYVGRPIMPREQFYEWALSSAKFHELFAAYEAAGYQRRLAPSADRLNPLHGYEIFNLEWVTHGENSRRSSLHRQHTEATKARARELVAAGLGIRATARSLGLTHTTVRNFL